MTNMATVDRPARHPARAQACSPTGPTASPPANCRQPRRRGRKASSATSSSRSGTAPIPKHYLHDLIATDQRNPTVNANGLIYGAVENTTDLIPVLDPVKHTREHRSRCRCAIRRRRRSKDDPMAPSPYWGDEAIWDSQTQHAQPDVSTRRAASGSPRASAAGQSGFLQAGLRSSVRQGVPARRPRPATCRCYDPKTGKITLIRTCFQTHHLVFAEDANNTLWTERRRAGHRACSAGSTARCSRRPATSRSRRAGRRSSSTPTATASATTGSSRTSRSIRPRTSASSARSTASASIRRTARSGASVLTFPGYVVRVDPGADPSRDRACRNLRAADAGLWPARRRHRPQRRRLGAAGERPHGRVRPPQVQGSAQRAGDRDRAALSGRLDALSDSPARSLRDVQETGSAEASYYTWVDQFDTFGLGQQRAEGDRQRQRVADGAGRRPSGSTSSCPIRSASTPSGWTAASTIRTAAGRAAACGRPTARARRSIIETGKGTRPKVVKFQLRPDPLAK